MASGLSSAWASIGSRSSTPYSSVVSRPRARSARTMTSRITGPRRLPTWTVPDGVFESLTTCGPLTDAASSSAQSSGGWPRGARPPTSESGCWPIRGGCQTPLADRDDLVREVAGRDADEDLLALLLAEQRPPDGALVRDPALGRLRLGRADDRERLLAVRAFD